MDVVQVVSAYVTLKKNGSRYWGLCPFHHEKTASFSVSPDKNAYYCFGCKAGGSVVQFVMDMERMTFTEAVTQLADQVRLKLPEMTDDPDYERRKSLRERLLKANQLAAQYYHRALWLPQNKDVLEYLYKRGLDDSVIRRFGLGASGEEWEALGQALTAEGFSRDELAQAGLLVVKGDHSFDMFRHRAMFPIIGLHGDVLGFGGRAMGDAQPKYLNTADTPVFNKRLGVYAVNLLKKTRDLKRVLLVEGYMDVVALSQFGVQGVVATLGTALTQEQARLLKRFAPQVVLAYDGDSAGQNAIMRGLDILEPEGIDARVLVFPDNLDPDEFIRRRGVEAFAALPTMSATGYRMSRLALACDLTTQDGRTEYAKKCALLLKRVTEPVELENHLQALMVQTGFSREVLVAQMGVGAPAVSNNPAAKRERLATNRAQTSTRSSEQLLLALLASGKLPKNMVRAEDFDDETLRLLAAGLLEGRSAVSLMDEAPDEQTRARACEAFVALDETQCENAAEAAEKCLKNIKRERLEKRVSALKEALSALSGGEKADALTEITALNKEINKLK